MRRRTCLQGRATESETLPINLNGVHFAEGLCGGAEVLYRRSLGRWPGTLAATLLRLHLDVNGRSAARISGSCGILALSP
jgi:hypothetical protein